MKYHYNYIVMVLLAVFLFGCASDSNRQPESNTNEQLSSLGPPQMEEEKQAISVVAVLCDMSTSSRSPETRAQIAHHCLRIMDDNRKNSIFKFIGVNTSDYNNDLTDSIIHRLEPNDGGKIEKMMKEKRQDEQDSLVYETIIKYDATSNGTCIVDAIRIAERYFRHQKKDYPDEIMKYKLYILSDMIECCNTTNLDNLKSVDLRKKIDRSKVEASVQHVDTTAYGYVNLSKFNPEIDLIFFKSEGNDIKQGELHETWCYIFQHFGLYDCGKYVSTN